MANQGARLVNIEGGAVPNCVPHCVPPCPCQQGPKKFSRSIFTFVFLGTKWAFSGGQNNTKRGLSLGGGDTVMPKLAARYFCSMQNFFYSKVCFQTFFFLGQRDFRSFRFAQNWLRKSGVFLVFFCSPFSGASRGFQFFFAFERNVPSGKVPCRALHFVGFRQKIAKKYESFFVTRGIFFWCSLYHFYLYF